MIQNLSTRLNSAADANFKSVFGTATVAEEPRDCTVQSASAYKSNGGVARNITVLGLKQICNDRKTHLLGLTSEIQWFDVRKH